jgi:hypothetical protein
LIGPSIFSNLLDRGPDRGLGLFRSIKFPVFSGSVQSSPGLFSGFKTGPSSTSRHPRQHSSSLSPGLPSPSHGRHRRLMVAIAVSCSPWPSCSPSCDSCSLSWSVRVAVASYWSYSRCCLSASSSPSTSAVSSVLRSSARVVHPRHHPSATSPACIVLHAAIVHAAVVCISIYVHISARSVICAGD